MNEARNKISPLAPQVCLFHFVFSLIYWFLSLFSFSFASICLRLPSRKILACCERKSYSSKWREYKIVSLKCHLHTSEQILTISEENSNYGKSSSPSVKACSNSKLKLHSKRHWFQSNLVWKGSVIASGTQIFADRKRGKGTRTNSQSFQ